MDKKSRPAGREKHVTGGGGDIHKRGDGLNLGNPTGLADGYSKRKQGSEASQDDRGILSSLGGNSSKGLERMAEQMILKEVTSDIKNKRFGRLAVIAVVVIVGMLLLGGGSLLSGMSGGSGQSDSLPSFASSPTIAGGNHTTKALNTKVDSKARDKRTVLAGDGTDTVTIMVYMCGTDLESKYGMATSDLEEMAAATLSDKVNLIVETGGCEQWKNQVVSNQTNQIYQVKDGGLKCLNDNVGAKPMTDPNTLSEYIRYCKKEFPADRYELILWDHGGGSTSGYGYDQLYAGNGSMTLDMISKALKDGGCTFDFIGFDACLMATLETALMLEPYADYMIASEETEPGVGWFYTNWLTELSGNTSISTLEIGKRICDDFVSVCGQRSPRDQTTLSVIDLAEVKGTVPEAFINFAKSTGELIDTKEYKLVADARGHSKEFAASSGIDQVDLIHLADNMQTPQSKELARVLRSCVKYNNTSSNLTNAYGVSIYFPYGKLSSLDKMIHTYSNLNMPEEYTKCIKSFASLEAGGQIAAGGTSSPLGSLLGSMTGGSSGAQDLIGGLLSTYLSGKGLTDGRSLADLDSSNSGWLDSEAVHQQADFLSENSFNTANLFWTEKEGQNVLRLSEEQWDLIQEVELNVFYDDGEGYLDLGLDNTFTFDGDGDLMADYDGTWLAINEQPVSYYMLSHVVEGDSYTITGRVPTMLNGQLVDLILTFDNENPNGTVAGARICYDQEEETQTQAKGLIELKEGDILDFICDYYSYDGSFKNNYYIGESMTVYGEPMISNVPIGSLGCEVTYRLTDIYQNRYWTPAYRYQE